MEMEETGLVLLWLDMIKSTVSTIYKGASSCSQVILSLLFIPSFKECDLSEVAPEHIRLVPHNFTMLYGLVIKLKEREKVKWRELD